MERLVRTGLSAIAAFALVMTVTLTAGATEKAVVTAKEKVAIEKITSATTVEAIALSVTAEKLIAKWAMEKALRRPKKRDEAITGESAFAEIQRTAKDNTAKSAATIDKWYTLTVTGSTWQVGLAMPTNPEPGEGEGCRLENEGDYCGILLRFDPDAIHPDNLENKTLAQISTQYGSAVQHLDEARSEPE